MLTKRGQTLIPVCGSPASGQSCGLYQLDDSQSQDSDNNGENKSGIITYGLNPSDTGNTIATDGNDGLMVRLGDNNDPNAHQTVVDGVTLHEKTHIAQFHEFAANPKLIVGQEAGIPIGVVGGKSSGVLNILENQAYTIEKQFLTKKLESSKDRGERRAIKRRLKTVNRRVKQTSK